ncbi:GTP 3',8-cyclase MoaA [Petroclostridium sp. X23]|uniref:GTP 3',8-cyclase MoaA n=1 Tax=Petroclostridium sp. X23 TaxID=3045146 RepID=UPI0024AD62D3|nr:GTP 3',8-cyclase MoaA [Petroclostridium sp. X23]WHH58811.1 GTP 3',8-cyclase MoaA [Petroclostridium sp. X23]
MRDRFGREIEYLRISITQNCNLKCIYCSPGGSGCVHEYTSYLTPEEIEQIVRSMARVGIKKVRVTGGEPLTRADICEIIQRIAGINGIEDLMMTTNGINLDKMAEKLKEAGLNRLNISLDSLKEDKFEYITGGGKLENTLKGIEKALDVGLNPVKINTVLIKGVNDDEIDDFIKLAKARPLEVRFIELMPIGKYGEQNSDKIIYNSEIINARPELIFCEDSTKGHPATYYTIEGYKGKIGFISPMSHKFCDRCNRIRLTSDGKIKPCLGSNGEEDVMEILRNNPEHLDEFIQRIIYEKPMRHHFEQDFSSARNMSMIGG